MQGMQRKPLLLHRAPAGRPGSRGAILATDAASGDRVARRHRASARHPQRRAAPFSAGSEECAEVHHLLPQPGIIGLVIGRMSLETAEALREVLDEGEAVVAAVPSVGSALVLTDQRLVIIRDGRSFRPRTGVRDWPLGPSLRIQVGPLRNGSGSLLIDRERGATSFFVAERDWLDALWIVDEAERRSHVTES